MNRNAIGGGLPESYRPHTVPKSLGAPAEGKPATDEGQAMRKPPGEAAAGRIVGKLALHLPVGPDLQAAADWYANVFELRGAAAAEGEAAALRLPSGGNRLVLWPAERESPGLCLSLGGALQPAATFNVKNVDRVHERVLAAGGESLMQPCDMFFRMAMFRDPFGNGLALLQEPFGWGKRIGRQGPAATFDWLKIPVRGTKDDLLRTAAWYGETFGLEPGPLTGEQDGLDLQPGNLHLQLVDTGFAGRFASGCRSVPLADLATDDIEAVYRNLSDAGAETSPIRASGTVRSLVFVDPNGVAMGVAQR